MPAVHLCLVILSVWHEILQGTPKTTNCMRRYRGKIGPLTTKASKSEFGVGGLFLIMMLSKQAVPCCAADAHCDCNDGLVIAFKALAFDGAWAQQVLMSPNHFVLSCTHVQHVFITVYLYYIVSTNTDNSLLSACVTWSTADLTKLCKNCHKPLGIT